MSHRFPLDSHSTADSVSSFGIIGLAGRMGQNLFDHACNHPMIRARDGFARNGYDKKRSPLGVYRASILEVFENNDYVVDFSSAYLSQELAKEAMKCPKPLVVCISALENPREIFNALAQHVPVVLSPNTSFGSALQKQIALFLAKILPKDYDVDLIERHHRGKKDAPSGTCVDMAQALVAERGLSQWTMDCVSPRQDTLNISVQRAGSHPGYQEVVFSGANETLSISHTALNRTLYAQGVMRILSWLMAHKPKAGFYTMEDVVGNHLQTPSMK